MWPTRAHTTDNLPGAVSRPRWYTPPRSRLLRAPLVSLRPTATLSFLFSLLALAGPLDALAEGAAPFPLPMGASLEREIAGGQAHPYSIRLEPGQLLRVVVRQQGINVAVKASAPDGRVLFEGNRSDGDVGDEPLSVVAPAGGEIAVLVRAVPPKGNSGRYRIEAELPRAPDARDLARLKAEHVHAEAGRRYLEGGPEAIRS